MNVGNWLRKTPRPVAILADDKRIEVPANTRAWRDLTATIASLDPTKLTALDGQGNVLRSMLLESDEDKPAPTPEMSDLQLFARLLAEGYQNGSKASQPIIDSAMSFVERQGQRLAKAESEIERLRVHIHKQNMQIAELSGASAPPEDSLMGAMLAGALQGGAGNPLAAIAGGAAKQGAKK